MKKLGNVINTSALKRARQLEKCGTNKSMEGVHFKQPQSGGCQSGVRGNCSPPGLLEVSVFL